MRGVIQHDNLNRRLMCTHEITETKLFSNWFQLDFKCDLLRPATSPPERSEWGRSGGQWGRIPHTHILRPLPSKKNPSKPSNKPMCHLTLICLYTLNHLSFCSLVFK